MRDAQDADAIAINQRGKAQGEDAKLPERAKDEEAVLRAVGDRRSNNWRKASSSSVSEAWVTEVELDSRTDEPGNRNHVLESGQTDLLENQTDHLDPRMESHEASNTSHDHSLPNILGSLHRQVALTKFWNHRMDKPTHNQRVDHTTVTEAEDDDDERRLTEEGEEIDEVRETTEEGEEDELRRSSRYLITVIMVNKMVKVAQGRVWTGKEAASRGLVDAIGGFSIVVAMAKQKADMPLGREVLNIYQTNFALGLSTRHSQIQLSLRAPKTPLSVSNPLSTQAGSTVQYLMNVTTAGNLVNIRTGIVNTTVTGTVYSDNQLAVYQVDRVLLPLLLRTSSLPNTQIGQYHHLRLSTTKPTPPDSSSSDVSRASTRRQNIRPLA
ncbi:hypothetical protein HYC85_030205 [Camellia sinensis]|uniref:Peptidase S49 domain-containing protein n=1 Tax=Camellia sinensis TaxID=4442 RepID=A0A7J7G3W8_CAMSI|nr:hypothetical protein HYC85_030205 [Camellia sinensis]